MKIFKILLLSIFLFTIGTLYVNAGTVTVNVLYTASFDSNGGTPTYSSVNYAAGDTVSSPGSPTRSGYTFSGWSSSLPSAMPSANTTYTAQWNVLDSCGAGSGGDPKLTEPTGVSACATGTLNSSSPSDTTTSGLQSWNWSCGTVTSCTAPKYGCRITTDSNYVLAQYGASGPNNNWGCATTCLNGATNYSTCTLATVTFNGNGSTGGSTASKTVTTGDTVTLSNGFTKTGYNFANWNTDAAGTGTSYANGTNYTTVTSTVTMYAQWTIIPPSDACNAGIMGIPQSSEPTGSAACDNGVYANSPADTTTSGLQAWNWSCGTVTSCTAPKFGCRTTTDSNYGLAQYGASGPNNNWGCEATCLNGATNYPTCTASHTITFNGNTNTGGSTATQTITEGNTAALRNNGFTKTGYSFTGWATTAAGAVAYANGANYTMGTSNVTLYAKWTSSVCTSPLTQNVTVACDVNSDGNPATTGSVTRSQTKSAFPGCTFGTPVTNLNSTYVSDNCVYPASLCSAPLTQNVTVACDVNSNGFAATSGSVTRSQTKSAFPGCTFGSPVTNLNSTYLSDNCVYPAVVPINGQWTNWETVGICTGCDANGKNGDQNYSRSCVGRVLPGLDCVGSSTKTEMCNCVVGGGDPTFTPAVQSIYKGKKATLNWTSPISGCTITDDKGVSYNKNGGAGDKSGTIEVTPKETTTYTLSCFSGAAQVNTPAQVKVIIINITEG